MKLKTWMHGVSRSLRVFTRRLSRDARGNVAMLFGLSLPVLILITVGGVDIHRASTVRMSLQDALDAASLAAARSPYVTDTDLQRVGLASLRANLKPYPGITLREADTSFILRNDVVIARSSVDVQTLVANIFLPPYGQFLDDTLPVGASSEVDRSSKNIEVALVLDITGSMAGQRITDLKAAAKSLVDLVVQPVQTPYYSKVALVPYSNSVNPGTYVTTARGPIGGATSIRGAVINFVGTQKSISAATRARPVVITSNGHGFSNGDVVWISSSSGMTQINNKAYRVTNKTTDTFELYTLGGSRVDGRTNYGTYSGNGKVQRCQNNDCSITITANSHGMSNNDYVRITDVNGMVDPATGNSVVNNKTFLVGNAQLNTFTIDPDAAAMTAYSSGGNAARANGGGDRYFAFENMNGDLQTHRASNCVTERTGRYSYTETAPTGSGSWVGLQYPDIEGRCITDTVVPLSSNAAGIKSRIDGLNVEGGTAGQIGIGWGWYMLSPSWNSLWPSGAAGPYNSARTLKAVVIMTDGEFNTPYCSGVIARNAGAGSGGNSAKIDCDADNGDPFAQSRQLCDAMKAQSVIVYAVGFQIAQGGDADTLLRYCASSSSGYYNAGSGTALSQAFAAIGRDITQLRISR